MCHVPLRPLCLDRAYLLYITPVYECHAASSSSRPPPPSVSTLSPPYSSCLTTDSNHQGDVDRNDKPKGVKVTTGAAKPKSKAAAKKSAPAAPKKTKVGSKAGKSKKAGKGKKGKKSKKASKE
eukprot:CAMPEP_0119471128 /NCGR_PEP_ID=MMETSP1344-20130328/3721_1 /TAXON_ID=236787 /ORGANISM="Florenciella parvula, Strain CCMP2471" /LENGTH=122 /DNA_ID=CAMNT_0007503869 /DNA_START=1078 /DNA_END=1447 /DNA_ORIENTATION=-